MKTVPARRAAFPLTPRGSRLALLTGIAFASAVPAAAQAPAIAIRAGGIVDPVAGTVSGPVVIVVRGDRIEAVGPGVPIPREARVIDLSRHVVLPGLIDTHTHLAAAFEPAATRLREYTIAVSTAERALQGVVNAWQMLEAGFTTVRDLGNAGNYADAAVAGFFGSGDPRRTQLLGGAVLPNLGLFGRPLVGPTIVFAGKIIAPFGGQFLVTPELPDIGRQDYLYADTRDELRRAVRQNLHQGATWIKVVVDDYPYRYSVEDLRFVVAEAAEAGARVTAHVATDAGARAAIEAGIPSLEHAYVLSDATLALARERGVVLVGTETAGLFMERFGATDHDRRMIERLRRAYQAGVPLAFGADIVRAPAGMSRGAVSLSVTESWVAAGVPAPDILRAMTVHAARLLGMEQERGQIRPGFAADLIATRASPIADIGALREVVFVMKGGTVVRAP